MKPLASILLLMALVVAPSAYAKDVCEPPLSWKQIFGRLRRAEALLSSGQPQNALRVITPVADQYFTCERFHERDDGREIDTRIQYVAATAFVRIPGGVSWYSGRSGVDQLDFALGWIRRAAEEGNPNSWSRYGEALVARGDEASLREAYELLSRLHAQDKILEPEGYAALTKAARAAGDEEMAITAQVRCKSLAPGRAKRTCPAV
jgi:hypothetical protein